LLRDADTSAKQQEISQHPAAGATAAEAAVHVESLRICAQSVKSTLGGTETAQAISDAADFIEAQQWLEAPAPASPYLHRRPVAELSTPNGTLTVAGLKTMLERSNAGDLSPVVVALRTEQGLRTGNVLSVRVVQSHRPGEPGFVSLEIYARETR